MLHWVKCAGCGDSLIAKLEADPDQLEREPVFVLCQECYVHMRVGYQRDRDRSLRLISNGALPISPHLIGHDNG